MLHWPGDYWQHVYQTPTKLTNQNTGLQNIYKIKRSKYRSANCKHLQNQTIKFYIISYLFVLWYPTFSIASVISPTVHRARAASMDSWSRLPWLLEQALVMASNASCACGRRNKIHLTWRFFCKWFTIILYVNKFNIYFYWVRHAFT